MAIINYREWVFDCDVQATQAAYGKIEIGDTSLCECDYCANFAAQRHTIYPQEVLDLFKQLGIDHTKEDETAEYGRVENRQHLHLYIGGFHFIGSILEGTDVAKTTEEKLVDSLKFENGFSLSFASGQMMLSHQVFNDLKVVAVQFSCELPWAIDKPEWD